MKALTLRLPEPTWERLREQAHQERTTITALILAAIDDDQQQHDHEQAVYARLRAMADEGKP